MEYTKYTTIKIREIEPNVCQSPICDKRQRKECEKEGKCLIWLCGSDEDSIAGISPYASYEDKDYEKQHKAVEKFRRKEFKKCKKIKFIIKEEK